MGGNYDIIPLYEHGQDLIHLKMYNFIQRKKGLGRNKLVLPFVDTDEDL